MLKKIFLTFTICLWPQCSQWWKSQPHSKKKTALPALTGDYQSVIFVSPRLFLHWILQIPALDQVRGETCRKEILTIQSAFPSKCENLIFRPRKNCFPAIKEPAEPPFTSLAAKLSPGQCRFAVVSVQVFGSFQPCNRLTFSAQCRKCNFLIRGRFFALQSEQARAPVIIFRPENLAV